MDVIRAWDQCFRGGRRKYRYDAEAALRKITSYEGAGISRSDACAYFRLHIDAFEAAQIQEAGVAERGGTLLGVG